MDAFVYVLGSFERGKCRTYVGWTDNIERRLTAHNEGKGARSTRGRVWFLLYAEKLGDRGAAMSRESYLKRDRTFRKQLADTTLGR